MLGLKLATDPFWVNIAEKSIDEILTDHAYCEQKAATTCISLIIQFPDRTKLVDELAPIVAEEWGHFRRVLKELKMRGFTFGKNRKDTYVTELMKFQRKGGQEEDRLTDKLLISAMIEARSCERFRLLSLYISDDNLKTFYHEFMVSEAGHYRTFLDLARLYAPEVKVLRRWKEMVDFEAEIMQKRELRGDRMH
ncbi:MAG: tRNA-(ms[2]io[6]A)-hydroxylase [Saprospiraceae bacterium]|jgi:tRNA-(ms[2]io[6]A)-hydroxylase|nr:tRNA-(ms[2]io[6]A)-hydroxylase [Saprospiraceae bacterium]MBL0026594.1 tRNA-(ms[2]io[6]A)-hydroxylase [Saprospiraceae bacterium]